MLSKESRKLLRKAGKRGGLAPHSKRGLQAASAKTRQRVSRAGVKARVKYDMAI